MLSFIPDFSTSTSWLGTAVGWIINLGVLMGSVGLGIILFTLFIKLVTMPFEIYSRVSMKKSSLAMEKVKPQLEKLKAQYKNDEATYRQKSMEIYKKNGFSPFKACLPILITLPLFFIIFSGFNNYSAWANVNNYSEMAVSYNQAIKKLAETENNSVKNTFSGENTGVGNTWTYTWTQEQGDPTNSLLLITRTVILNASDGPKVNDEKQIEEFFIKKDSLENWMNRVDSNWYKALENTDVQYAIKLTAQPSNIEKAIQASSAVKTAADAVGIDFSTDLDRANAIIERVGSNAAEAKYRENERKNKFLWVGNIWNSDVSYVHPVSYDTFKKAGINLGVTNISSEEMFNKFTANLSYERDKKPNGFYIIIFLSAGALFTSQFFITRQSKTQNDLMQGKGKAASIMKWIPLILIPAMYIWFGFTYSMAYMLYLFLSSTISFVSNLIVNAIIEKKFMKQEAENIQSEYNKRIPNAHKK